jgi:hypothetical protein
MQAQMYGEAGYCGGDYTSKFVVGIGEGAWRGGRWSPALVPAPSPHPTGCQAD